MPVRWDPMVATATRVSRGWRHRRWRGDRRGRADDRRGRPRPTFTEVAATPGGWTFHGPEAGLPADVYGASEDQGGNLWVAGGREGLFLLRKGATRFERFGLAEGLTPYGMWKGKVPVGEKLLDVRSVHGGPAGRGLGRLPGAAQLRGGVLQGSGPARGSQRLQERRRGPGGAAGGRDAARGPLRPALSGAHGSWLRTPGEDLQRVPHRVGSRRGARSGSAPITASRGARPPTRACPASARIRRCARRTRGPTPIPPGSPRFGSAARTG